MNKLETPEESPPTYHDALRSAAALYQYPPPPPYSLPDPQQFPDSSSSAAVQFCPQTGHPAAAHRPEGSGNIGAATLPWQPSQHHQQEMVLFGAGQLQAATTVERVQSFAGHFVVSCTVMWTCNFLFGLIAFILAVIASSLAVSDPPRARQLGRTSVGLSLTGVLVTVVIVAVVLNVARSARDTTTARLSCAHHAYRGHCYRYKTFVGSSGSCDAGMKSPSGYCYSNDCHHYAYRGSCYIHRQYVGMSDSCIRGVKSADGYCYSTTCPNHEYKDACYRYRKYVGRSMYNGACNGRRSREGFCYYNTCPYYSYHGSCYKYRDYVGPHRTCSGLKSSDGYCYYYIY